MSGNYNKDEKKCITGGGPGLDDATSQYGNCGYINGAWTTAMYVILPTAALTLLWGQQGFITRFFLQFKKTHVSDLHPSADKRSRLLKWIDDHLKYTWFLQLSPDGKSTADYWKNGSLLCSLINSAIPGACSNPQRHWNERPSHGQNLAHKYLDITPIFTEDDFKNEKLPGRKDYQFSNYLNEVQAMVDNVLQREVNVSTQYTAKGMGLVTGEQFKKSTFYIYNNHLSLSNNTDVVISITGPYGTHCSYTIARRRVSEKRRLAYVSKAQRFLFKSISMELGAIVQTNREQASSENIPIKVSNEKDRVKVVFIPQAIGWHQISIVTNASHLIGSPFLVDIVPQSTTLYESFDNDTEVTRTNSHKRIKKKVVSVVIDCIDEQIVLYNPSSIKETQPYWNIFDRNLDNKIALPAPPTSKELSIIPGSIHREREQNELSNIVKADTASEGQDFGRSYRSNSAISQEESFLSSIEDIATDQIEFSKTSPIRAMHIDNEVINEVEFSQAVASLSGNKKPLQRQCRINHGEKSMDNTKLERLLNNYDANFETTLHGEDYNKRSDIYTDSYLTELELPPHLLSKSKNLLFLHSDDVAQTHYYCNKPEVFAGISPKPTPKARLSLPNILQSSNTDDILYQNHMEPFSQRQEYWKALSAQSLSYSSTTSSHNYLNTISNTPKYNKEVTKSLPNLGDLSKARLNNINLGSDFEEDFYSGYQADYFRDRYLKCRNYWETLSRRNLSFSTDMVAENDFDSGYYASLPNLSADIDDGHRVSKQFREKQLFWENLSLGSSKWVQSQNKKQNLCNTIPQASKIIECKTLLENENIINEYEKETIFKEEEEANLTDDVKEINLMKFAQARNFFRNLENIGT